MSRIATVNRTTKETDIAVTWDLDHAAPAEVSTGIGFLDHMLDALGKHSGTALKVRCKGDLHIDGHHTTEDVGIERFGHMACPLDEALVTATLDISGRPYLVYDLKPEAAMLGTWAVELVPEFFGGLTDHARICLHLHQQCGRNTHHIVEAAFKATARALRQAIKVTGNELPSTKGLLG